MAVKRPAATSADGGGVPPTAKAPRTAHDLWVKVKGASRAIKVATTGIDDADALLKMVREKVKPRLDGVPVDSLMLYASENEKNEGGQAFRSDKMISDIVGGQDSGNPLYVDLDKPAQGASRGEAVDLNDCVKQVQLLLVAPTPAEPAGSFEEACGSNDLRFVDYSFGIPWRGRSGFFEHLVLVLEELLSPPDVIQGTRSVVYSTVSGAGKTRAMLSLERELRARLVKAPLVVYIGFNCGAALQTDEENCLTTKASTQRLLYRRLIVAVLATLHVRKRAQDAPALAQDREVGAVLPNSQAMHALLSKIPLDACEQTRARTYLKTVLAEIGIKHFVVGVDEIQKLDEHVVSQGQCGLGRFLLRELRDLQLHWGECANPITVLPLGTGITPDFTEAPTNGQHVLFSSSNELLLSMVEYKEILSKQLTEVHETDFHEHGVDTIARMLWPIVRVLEKRYLKTVLSKYSLKRDLEVQEVVEIIDSVLFGKGIAKSKFPSDLVPFIVVDETKVRAFPHALCARPLATALGTALPCVKPWLDNLPWLDKSIRNMAASVLKHPEFQAVSFAVLGAYIALVLARATFVSLGTTSHHTFIDALKPFASNTLVMQDRSPMMEATSASYYPFTNQFRSALHEHFQATISNLRENSAVGFHAGHGTNARADYVFVIRGADRGGACHFHVLVGDAKHTTADSGKAKLEDTQQVQDVRDALLKLLPQLQGAEVTTTLFVISPAMKRQSGWPEEVALLNGASFEFLPWTLFLFRESVESSGVA